MLPSGSTSPRKWRYSSYLCVLAIYDVYGSIKTVWCKSLLFEWFVVFTYKRKCYWRWTVHLYACKRFLGRLMCSVSLLEANRVFYHTNSNISTPSYFGQTTYRCAFSSNSALFLAIVCGVVRTLTALRCVSSKMLQSKQLFQKETSASCWERRDYHFWRV